MFPYSPSNNPAVRSHLDSQFAYFNDLNQALTGSFQAVCEANLRLGRTMIEETMQTGQRMLSSERAVDAIGAAAAHAQPASDKVRAYQQHLSRLAAEVQVELARVNQQHGPETARTAHALADEVTRISTEETARSMQQQEDLIKKFRDPFQPTNVQRGNAQGPDRTTTEAERASKGAGTPMQADGGADKASMQGQAQGQSVQSADNKPARKPA